MHHHSEQQGLREYAQQQPINQIHKEIKRYLHNKDKHLYLLEYKH